MGFLNTLRFYRVRLRTRIVQESLAVLGIAAGVALLFASQIASQSLQSSVGELSRGVVGDAKLQLIARGPHGYPESLLGKVRQIPGVRTATPVLEANANAIGPKGRESIELIGADESIKRLGGTLVRHTELSSFGGIGAVVLPSPLSRKIGVRKFGQEVTLQIAGHTVQAPLYSQLHQSQIGSLVASPVALAPLFFAQEVTGLTGRVSRILVAPSAHREGEVRKALEQLAAGRLNVESTAYDGKLFAKAAAASNQSTALFSAIAALVGFLFAFNATLLTVPQRRQLITDLRRNGYTPRTVIGVLLLDAIMLGVIGCALGLALGEEFSIHVLHSNPAFLSLAFTVGTQRAVSIQSIAIAISGGMLAAVVAVMSPLRDILSEDPIAAIMSKRDPVNPRSSVGLALAGVLCIAGATVLLLKAPDAAIPGMILLVSALLLILPFLLSVMLNLVKRAAALVVSPIPHVATMELSAARARAVAITATGAIAIFGSVAIRGAHGDLLSGLEGAARGMNSFTDVWVSPAGGYNLLKTTPFAPTQRAKLERLPGVRSVGLYRSGLLDYGERRVLVMAPPSQAATLMPAGQILQGDPHTVEDRLRGGGWVVLSKAIAAEQHLHVGQTFTLPSPEPTKFRVAGLSTNLGWAPGSIIMGSSDYAHAWSSADPSAYSVMLAPGVSPTQGVHEIERALGPNSGFSVQTAGQHLDQQQALDREALARLTQISTLIPIVAVLAMAAAMGAMVWQRRPRLAKLKLEGLARVRLWQTILFESLLLLSVGCLAGAIFGLYGQQLADRALAEVINFPVTYSIAPLTALASLGLVTATAVAILAIPGYFAASVPAALALQE